MPIKIKTDLEFGQTFYLKNDPEQLEHSLVGVILLPSGAVQFILSYMGDHCEVYDFEATVEPDKLRQMENKDGDIDK